MSSIINLTYSVSINNLYLYEVNYLMRIKGLGERYIIAKGNAIEGIVSL